MFGCCITIDTIQSLLDDGRDVLNEIVTGKYVSQKKAALLSMYRFRMIGSCDADRWVRAMTDRYTLLTDQWDARFDIWNNTIETKDLADLDDRRRSLTESVDSQMTDQSEYEREDIPETADASTSRYLSERTNDERSVDAGTDRTVTETERTGLITESLERAVDAVPALFMAWAREFSDLFLNRC